MKYEKIIAVSLVISTSGLAGAAELRAGLNRYDGGAALYALADGQNVICDECPRPPALINAPQLPVPVSENDEDDTRLIIDRPLDMSTPLPVVMEQEKYLATVYFKFNDARLQGKQKAAIREAISKIDTPFVVRVDAYTCRIGSARYNRELSNRRAKTVAAYLRSLGIKVSQAEGHGKTHPLGGALAKDRRAVILIKERVFLNEDK